LIEYIKYNHIFNIAKNVNDESANKLTASKSIAYNGKMPTTNNSDRNIYASRSAMLMPKSLIESVID
jgi:hypothetical protein